MAKAIFDEMTFSNVRRLKIYVKSHFLYDEK